jgi:hypothetical protein
VIISGNNHNMIVTDVKFIVFALLIELVKNTELIPRT